MGIRTTNGRYYVHSVSVYGLYNYSYCVLYVLQSAQTSGGSPHAEPQDFASATIFVESGGRLLLDAATEGLRRAIVDALPVFVYRPESFKDGLRCAVCLCEFQENDKARILPGCNHSFHVDCIDMWFHSHSTCPLCRASVDAQSVELGLRQTEVSVIEEGGGGEKRDSVAAEPVQNEYLKQNNDERKKAEEGSRSDVVIDIPTS